MQPQCIILAISLWLQRLFEFKLKGRNMLKGKFFSSYWCTCFFVMKSERFLRLILVVGMLVFIPVFIIGCNSAGKIQPETSSKIPPEPYFPTQKEAAKAYMATLLQGGTLIIDNAGYIRIGTPGLTTSSANGPLIIWPYGYSFKTEGTNILIINDEGQTVASVGDKLDIGGGFVDASVVEVLIGHTLPKNAVGPYYIAAPLQASQ